MSSTTADGHFGSGERRLGGAAVRQGAQAIGKRLAGRAVLAPLGPIGWAIGGALLAYDAYELYKLYNESHEETDGDKPQDTCDAKCQEARQKAQDEKIEELDEQSTQEPGDRDFNRNRPGDFNDANRDFDELDLDNVKDQGNGIRTGTTVDGRKVTVRPDSRSTGGPTLDINPPQRGLPPIRKYRYRGTPTS